MTREWYDLPLPLQLRELARMRDRLRSDNLHDTYGAGGERPRRPSPGRVCRSYDGSGYDPDDADMGAAHTRFDRNVPLELAHGDPASLMSPSPREVSNRLLARTVFKPATTLNVLAAAWIHFQNHDWFSHGRNPVGDPMEVPLADDDPWPSRPMRVRRTQPDPVPHAVPGAPPTFENTVTHWWDGSQLYGSDERTCRELRTGEDGRMRVEDGRLPLGPLGLDLTGFSDNYWVGLSLLHTLFVKEHNAICAHLRRAHPRWGDERLFQTARLVNAAVMAKIHTIDWTPALLDNRAVRLGMTINWRGLLGKPFRGEVLGGIRRSPMDHHGVPYSITEEFVTCYRMHPLIPDDWEIRSHRTGEVVATTDFTPLQGYGTRAAIDEHGWSDWFYTFGTAHPGAITLHNHPEALRNLRGMFGEHLDLGAVDVLRDRERGVPRYTKLREALHKPPIHDFSDLSDDVALKDVYEGDIHRIDAMVGMYAEQPPPGFAFSDTAFRLFILMASRRLKSDPFFTTHYTPEVYSPEGLAWIERTRMRDVLRRHHPELDPGVRNPFTPWKAARA
ncbi:peroxidase family protein [Nonomuraea sp. NPDC050328]|uniref:peroxidase family protein n=1 Tax=Nonomuraea sp. NPDC050328 TaxID=3364361 RepID=UPI0037A09E67